MTTAPTPLDHRIWLLTYERIALAFQADSRGYHALAAETFADRDRFGTFAEAVANELSRRYEGLGVFFAEQAGSAQGLADWHREQLNARLNARAAS